MASHTLPLVLVSRAGTRERATVFEHTVIAGWTGRDREAMEKHIDELAELGVPRPAATPMYYRVAGTRLTVAPQIEVSGEDSSGEVEFLLAQLDGRLWVGVGSDHTDRKLETVGVAISKQLCDKPISPALWPFDEVADHWDELMLRSFIIENGERRLYQEGPVRGMLPPLQLIAGWCGDGSSLPEGTVMFCGTLAAHGGIRPAGRFEFELADPVLKRTLAHAYDVECLPIAG